MNGRKIYWPRGRTLGGSVVDQRPDLHPRPARGLRPLGGSSATRAGATPTCCRSSASSSTTCAAPSEWHGADGPLWASDIGRSTHPLVEAFIARRRRARHSAQRRLQRRRAGRRRLLPADHAPRPALLDRRRLPASGARRAPTSPSRPTRTRRASLFDGRRARGVVYRAGRARRRRSTARREVILAAGALQSPQLLQLSGVGPPALLQRFGIPRRARAPGVGENLQDHLQARVIFRCTQPITTNDMLRIVVAASSAIGLDFVLRRARADGGRHQPGRHLRARDARRDAARRAVPFRDAVVRHGGLAGAHVLRASRCRCASCGPNRAASSASRSPDPLAAPRDAAELPVDAARPRDARRRHAARAAARGDARAGAVRRRRISARRRRRLPTTSCSSSRRTPAARSSIRAARCKMGPASDPLAVVDRGAARAWLRRRCASSTAASCRRSCRATPTCRSS